MKSEVNLPVVKCPHCGYEYHLSEIYFPEDFIGHPDQIIKDALGKILYVDYEEEHSPALEAKYVCDGCGKPFVVTLSMSVKSEEESKELDFSEEYVSLLD